jgi:hypothetical protein
MAEPRQSGPPMPPGSPPERLQRWFAAEVRAAERDVKRGLVSVPSTSMRRGVLGRRGFAGGAVAASAFAVLLVVALTSGFLGGTVGPSPTAGSGQPTASSGIVLGANGIPVSIDGEQVLTPSAGVTRALVSTDASTFLVGGWLSDLKASCPPQAVPSAEPALLDTGICGGQPALLGSPPFDTQGQPAVDWNGRILWTVFLGGTSPAEPRPSSDTDQAAAFNLAVVVRVHTHDPSAASCSSAVRLQCDLAVVVNTVVWRATVTPVPIASPSGALYAAGIPAAYDGQTVLRPTQAAAEAAASTDASPFLIGGWVTGWFPFPYSSCPLPSGSEADQVLDQGPCGVYLAESPVIDQTGPVKLHFQVGLSDGRYSGPVIVRVHTHDPLATSCAAANQDACAHAVVVDTLLWDGPALGPDGLPSWIDGQATISVPKAQETLAQSSSATELFVRGWYSGFALPCPFIPATVPPTPGSSLLPDDCQPSILGPAAIPLGQDHATADDLDLTLGPGVDAPPIGEVVLEVHGHDPAATLCDPSIRPACDAAVIVDRVVWTASTGIVSPAPTTTPAPPPVDVPASIDGQPILRGQAFVDRVNQATDGTSFLVGGWTPVTPEVYHCPFFPAPSPGVSFDPAVQALCGGLWFLDTPGDPQVTVVGGPPWVAVRIGVVTSVPVWGAPFVMRVHVQVPSVSCQGSAQAACERLVVEESLVWEGPPPSR